MTQPHFVVAGPPEAGGCELAAALARHPRLRLDGSVPATRPDALVGDAVERQWGEVSPYLLADFTAARRLHEHVAYPRLLVMLRDPVDRAYAAWARARSAGSEPLADFGAALAAEPSRVAAGCGWGWRYAELGRYGGQLRRLYSLYSPSQVLLIQYGDLATAPGAVLERAHAFLGVGPGRPADRPAGPAPLDAGAPADVRTQAVELFRDDVRLLESVTRRPFAAWLTVPGVPVPAPRH